MASTLLLLTMASFLSNSLAFTPSRPSQSSSRRGKELQYLDSATITPCNGQAIQAPLDQSKLGTLAVPSVGIGSISWTPDSFNTLESIELQDLVQTACQSNAAFFDTAERYGSSLKAAIGLGWGETEQLLKHLLGERASGNDDSLLSYNNNDISLENINNAIVATKFTPSPWRTTVESVVEACEESRRRLGVDQIDLYQLHMPDIVQPFNKVLPGTMKQKDEIYWEGLAECYKRGLVKNVGVCNYGPTLLRKCQSTLAAQGVPLASNQIAYSLLGRHNGAQETLDYCKENGIAVLAFFPYAMGLLTGKYSSVSDGKNVLPRKAKGTVLDSLLASKKSQLESKELQAYAAKIGPLLRVMEDIAAHREKTVSQVALNYVMTKGAIPIPGARTTAQLKDNLGSLGWRLTDEEVSRLEKKADSLGFGFDGAGFKRASEKFVGYGMEKWTLD